MYSFEQAGTQLIDILTGKDFAADDIATEITTVVNARGAKEEQIKISNNTLRAKVSLAKEGMPISKLAPYGYDKKYVDAAGKHLWTTHVLTASKAKGGTKYLIIMPDGNRYERIVPPRKNKTDRIIYVPTQEAPERIEVVRYAFRVFAEESITVAKLAIRLNQLGHTIYGKPWLKMTLEDLPCGTRPASAACGWGKSPVASSRPTTELNCKRPTTQTARSPATRSSARSSRRIVTSRSSTRRPGSLCRRS